MKKNLAVISSPEFGEIRSMMIDKEPWFVAADVCGILGISNNRDAVLRLDEDEKKDGVAITDTVGRKNFATLINESGIYTLVFQSRKPEARTFRKWVTSEVLPNIRKHGFYMTPEVTMSAKNTKQLRKKMLELMQKYLIEEDIRKCALRFGVATIYVSHVLWGKSDNNDIMAFLQEKAMENRKKWFDAYNHGRMVEVLNTLNGK